VPFCVFRYQVLTIICLRVHIYHTVENLVVPPTKRKEAQIPLSDSTRAIA
jgi:hypothetical protein